MASGARKMMPIGVATVPPMMNPTRRWSANASRTRPVPSRTAAERGEAVRRLRAGRAPRQGGHDGDPRHGARRPPGGDDRGDEREEHGRRDGPPRQGEGGRCDARRSTAASARTRTTPARPDRGADDGGGGADGGAVGQHDQSDVAVGRADRAEHAQGPEAPLRHDGEPGDRHQADEHQPERAQHEHEGLGTDLVRRRPAIRCRRPCRSGGGTTGGPAGRRSRGPRRCRGVGLAGRDAARTGPAGSAGSRPGRRPAASGRLRSRCCRRAVRTPSRRRRSARPRRDRSGSGRRRGAA